MTDEQIIKYWNEIDSEIINEHGEEFDVYITMPVAKSTVDLINRQKAEIKQWKEEANKYQNLWCIAVDDISKAKSEAIKEFAERLKCGVPQETGVIRCADVDNLVKEMTE